MVMQHTNMESNSLNGEKHKCILVCEKLNSKRKFRKASWVDYPNVWRGYNKQLEFQKGRDSGDLELKG